MPSLHVLIRKGPSLLIHQLKLPPNFRSSHPFCSFSYSLPFQSCLFISEIECQCNASCEESDSSKGGEGLLNIGSASGTCNGRFNGGLTPDLARALACWTVLMALRHGEVLNEREHGLERSFRRRGHRVGCHTASSRRQRALEKVLWRLSFTKTEFEKLEVLGQRNDIVESCLGRLKFWSSGHLYMRRSELPLWLARSSRLVRPLQTHLPYLTQLRM